MIRAVCFIYAVTGIQKVRSEISMINARKLISKALSGIGNGGGHPTMAGGIIYKENVDSLGNDHDYTIRKLFIDAVNSLSIYE